MSNREVELEFGPRPTTEPRIALQALLDNVLGEIDSVVGYEEASLMAYDPDVLLPVAFAVAGQREPTYAQDACRNEQLEPDVHKLRGLAKSRPPAAVLHRSVVIEPAHPGAILPLAVAAHGSPTARRRLPGRS